MAGKNCTMLEPLNPRSERTVDNAPRADGGSGYHRQARRPRVMGAEMMSEERAADIEGFMRSESYAVPVYYGHDD